MHQKLAFFSSMPNLKRSVYVCYTNVHDTNETQQKKTPLHLKDEAKRYQATILSVSTVCLSQF